MNEYQYEKIIFGQNINFTLLTLIAAYLLTDIFILIIGGLFGIWTFYRVVNKNWGKKNE